MNSQETCDHKIKLHVDKITQGGDMWIYINMDAKEMWPDGCCPLCTKVFKVVDVQE